MGTTAATRVNVDERRPVWLALSEFYLDTELDDRDCERIARILCASPYTLEEIEKIYREEITPVVWLNGLSPAGVWDAFDPEWLCAEAAKRAQNQSLTLRAAKAVGADRLMTDATDELWRRTAAIIQQRRSENSA